MNINKFLVIILFVIIYFDYSYCQEILRSDDDTLVVDSVVITYSNTIPIEERKGEIKIYPGKMFLTTFPIFTDSLLIPEIKNKLNYKTNLIPNDCSDNQLLRLFVKELFVDKKYQIIRGEIKTDYRISHSNPKKIDVYIYKKGECEKSSFRYEYSILGQYISLIDGYEVHYEPRFVMFYILIYNLFKDARNGL